MLRSTSAQEAAEMEALKAHIPPEFWGIKPQHDINANLDGPPKAKEGIRDQVKARLALAQTGTMMAAFGILMGREEFKSAPLRDPPVKDGMVATIDRIKDVLLKHGAVASADLAEMPGRFRRVRHLLRVYYDAKLTKRRSAEFMYCDMQDIADVGLALHEVGVYLQLSAPRFRALLSAAPEMEAFILDDPIDLGRWRLEAARALEAVARDEEADDDDRGRAMGLEDKSGEDCAAYQLAFFLGDTLVAFLLQPANTVQEKERQEKAMKRLVEMSTKPTFRDAFGDPLTDAMRPVYWTPKLLLRFVQAGGMPALIGDWAESTCKDGVCKTAAENLPAKAWDNQTPESLETVMRYFIKKLEMDGPEFATTPIFAKMMHAIYTRYGLAPFAAGSRLSDHEIIFYFLHRRVSKKPKSYSAVEDWAALLRKYENVPSATRRRHGWMILSVSGRWDCLDLYGCAYEGCPEKSAMQRLRAKRVRGRRDAEVEERLFRWGGASKACSRCRYVSYCSVACQKAHWKKHKPKCDVEAAKGKKEDIDI